TAPATGRHELRAVYGGDTDFAAAAGSSSLTVDRAEQVIHFAPPSGHVYGDAPVLLGASASSGLPVSFVVLSGPATLSPPTGALTLTGAGTVTIEARQVGDGTFDAAPPVEQSFSVGPASLTVTADDQTTILGTALPALTASFRGFVNGDGPASLTGPVILS